MKPILMWPFKLAPEEYRKNFCPDGALWLALVPASMVETLGKIQTWVSFLQEDCDFGASCTAARQLEDGRAIVVGWKGERFISPTTMENFREVNNKATQGQQHPPQSRADLTRPWKASRLNLPRWLK